MRNNLENRPKCSLCACCKRREEWIQGFEKELREMLRVMRARKKISKRATDFYFEMKQIKEILGDE